MRRRILLVNFSSHFGGAERSLYDLFGELASVGKFAPTLVTNCHAAVEVPNNRDAQIEVIPVRALPFKTSNPFAIAKMSIETVLLSTRILWIAHKRGAVLIHANGVKSVFPSILAARMLGIPCVWHVRDYPRRAFLTILAGRLSRAILCPSSFIRHAILKSCFERAPCVHVVYNPVALPSGDRSSASAQEGLEVTFAMLAQLVPWKRQDLFIKAATLVAARYPQARFLMAGDDISGRNPAYVAHLEALVLQSGLEAKLTVLGNQRDVSAVLYSCDVLVLPSQLEPFGRVVVEAWLARRPVIVSDCGGPAEFVTHEENGLLFKCGDVSDLASMMERLLIDSSLRRQLGVAGAEAAKQFDVESHTRKVLDVFEGILG